MTRDSRLELKVGSFVLLALGILSFFVASVSDLSFAQKGVQYQVVFNFANGLREAAPVRLAGVDAGLVKKLEVMADPNENQRMKVRATIWLKEGILVPMDSTVTINQLGLLGEKYVEILPGKSTEFLKPHSVVIGHDPIAMEKLIEQANVIVRKVETTIDTINEGILSEKNRRSFETILEGLSRVAVQLKEGQGTVGKLLHDESIFRNLEELTADLKSNPWKLLYRPKK